MSEALSTAEQQYFDSGGTAELPGDAAATTPTDPVSTEGTANDQGDQVQVGDQGQKTAPDSRTVPLPALHEERERRRELQRENQQLKAEREADKARMDERFRALQAMLAPPPSQPQPVPDFNTDPKGHYDAEIGGLKQQVAQYANKVQQFEQWQQQLAAQQQQAQQQAELVNRARTYGQQHEAEFRQTAPDYDAAAAHLRASREAQLRALGYGPDQVTQQMHTEVLQVAAMAMQQGRNFGETVYNLAKAAGYTPKQAKAVAQAAQADTAATAQQMATQQRGQQLGTGLGSAGSAAPTKLTLEVIDKMSEKEFAKLLNEQPEVLRELMS